MQCGAVPIKALPRSSLPKKEFAASPTCRAGATQRSLFKTFFRLAVRTVISRRKPTRQADSSNPHPQGEAFFRMLHGGQASHKVLRCGQEPAVGRHASQMSGEPDLLSLQERPIFRPQPGLQPVTAAEDNDALQRRVIRPGQDGMSTRSTPSSRASRPVRSMSRSMLSSIVRADTRFLDGDATINTPQKRRHFPEIHVEPAASSPSRRIVPQRRVELAESANALHRRIRRWSVGHPARHIRSRCSRHCRHSRRGTLGRSRSSFRRPGGRAQKAVRKSRAESPARRAEAHTAPACASDGRTASRRSPTRRFPPKRPQGRARSG